MPIKAKYNGSYKDITDLMNVDESIDYVLAKTSSSYKRVYTATRSIEDAPPTTFKSIKPGANLTDYRIYGQTVDGESVGDRTGNLFDKNAITIGYAIPSNGVPEQNENFCISNFIDVSDKTFCKVYNLIKGGILWALRVHGYNSSKDWLSELYNYTVDANTPISSVNINIPSNVKYIRMSIGYVNRQNLDILMFSTNTNLNDYEPYGYKVPVTVSNGTDTLATPIYLPEQIRKVGNEAEYIDYGEQKQHRVRKNLLPNTATSVTINGVTFTVNSDGSVTCNTDENGATVTTYLVIHKTPDIPESTNLILSGCPKGGSVSTYALQYSTWVDVAYTDTGNGEKFTKYDYETYPTTRVAIRIYKGYVCNNLTFYPMIRKADIEDDTYEPYITNTNLDVSLPALPTLPGTNVLSVGTEVQPSKIDITGHIKTISGGS